MGEGFGAAFEQVGGSLEGSAKERRDEERKRREQERLFAHQKELASLRRGGGSLKERLVAGLAKSISGQKKEAATSAQERQFQALKKSLAGGGGLFGDPDIPMLSAEELKPPSEESIRGSLLQELFFPEEEPEGPSASLITALTKAGKAELLDKEETKKLIQKEVSRRGSGQRRRRTLGSGAGPTTAKGGLLQEALAALNEGADFELVLQRLREEDPTITSSDLENAFLNSPSRLTTTR